MYKKVSTDMNFVRERKTRLRSYLGRNNTDLSKKVNESSAKESTVLRIL